MIVLGIETSCDETAVALYDSNANRVIGQKLHSQTDLHRLYGGVVPELASRDHARCLAYLTRELLEKNHLDFRDVQGLAYTEGPGLVSALLVGAMFGRSLAYSLNISAVGIHHMEAHLLITLFEHPEITFPFLALLVSGGHTLLVQVNEIGQYQIFGESLDDAVGETFDKAAKLLGLPYPGGPAIETLAQKGKASHFKLPHPLLNQKNFNFSFSGLKTALLNVVQKQKNLTEPIRADIAYIFQKTVVEILLEKTRRTLRHTQLNQLVIVGGVSANQTLRQAFDEGIKAEGINVYYPSIAYCTDNAVMVAYSGYHRLNRGERADLAVKIKPKWSLETLG